MKVSYTAKALLLLTVVMALFSFVKFDHCYSHSWMSPDEYTHACYSDIPALYDARNLVDHVWPYSSATNAIEYPPIMGVVMWATALVSPHSIHGYFLVNVFLIALLFIASALLIAKINPRFWYLFPICPAVIGSLYINWDIWAVALVLGSILLFERQRYEGGYGASALLLGLSIATKFFPIVLLAPIFIIFYRRKEIASGVRYIALALGTYALINLPFALTTPTGWWRFFSMNSHRPADFGSLWYALQLLGWSPNNINVMAVFCFIAAMAVFCIFLLRIKYTPSLAQVAFIAAAIFTLTSKVYSPQYVLWLAPLGVIALTRRSDRSAFWIWQGSELLYHLAIWEYLATSSGGGRFGITGVAYAWITLGRIAATGYFALKIGQSVQNPSFEEASTPLINSTIG